ncbi:hypothetical protein As57867_015066, partial [Aphanomyces stellatus]
MSTEVKYSPLSHPISNKGIPGSRRCHLLLAASISTLGLLLVLDLHQDNSHVRQHANKGAEVLQNTINYVRDTNFHYFSPSDDELHREAKDDDAGCRVQFVFAGSKYDYNQFPTMQSWIRYADPKCPIELIRPNHAVFNQLTPSEKEVFYDSAYLPILQADFMKLLVIYYLGGLVTD